MKRKQGVRIDKLQPQMMFAVFAVEKVYDYYGLRTLITSGNEDAPGRLKTSKHPKGEALDFEAKHIKKQFIQEVLNDLRSELGEDFDVVLSELVEGAPCIHIEYDPKYLKGV